MCNGADKQTVGNGASVEANSNPRPGSRRMPSESITGNMLQDKSKKESEQE